MKIFLLVVAIWLLFDRIKATPRMLSKKLHIESITSAINELTEKITELEKENPSKNVKNVFKGLAVIIVLTSFIFVSAYYSVIGNMFIENKAMLFMSVLQIVLSAYAFLSFFKQKEILSLDINDYKFKRYTNLLNVVLDYVYYPMTILLLLKR